MKIREYKLEDCKEVYELYYNTVHSVNLKDYTQEQVNAWASNDIDIEKWGKSFLQHYSIVIEQNNIIIGFGDIDNIGYLDRLYVHKDYQGIGVATTILNNLEQYVKNENVRAITTNASITLKPVLEIRGYTVIKEQQVERRGQLLTNFQMIKKL